MTAPKRFVSWIAVSSLPQAKKISLEDQLQTNLVHVEKWRGVLVAELSVPGKSRSIVTWEEACSRIEAYAQLRELINARAFDVLIYRDNSRLGRTTSLVVTIAELCYRAGIVMYATDSPPQELAKPTRNLAARITDVFQSVIAQDEVDKFQRRNEMGMKARVMRGDFPGSVPFGWVSSDVIENGKAVTVIRVEEVAAAAIRTIIDLYTRKGYGMRPIAIHLNAHGYTTARGGKWSMASISQTLDLIWRYAGYVEVNAKRGSAREHVRAKSKWPAIISEQDAANVERERKYRAGAKRRVQSPHRLSGVVWCGRCQKRMAATSCVEEVKRGSPVGAGARRRRERFLCRDMEVLRRHAKAEIATSFIVAAVRESFESMQDEGNHAAVLRQTQGRGDEIRAGMAAIEEALSRQSEALQRADDAYVDGKMDIARYNQQVDRIKAQWEALQVEMKESRRALEQATLDDRRGDRLKEVATNGFAMLETEDVATANAWMRQHIKVWVYNDHSPEEDRIVVEYV